MWRSPRREPRIKQLVTHWETRVVCSTRARLPVPPVADGVIAQASGGGLTIGSFARERR